MLLESWALSQSFLSPRAYRIKTLEELSAPLRAIARRANGGDSVWMAWADGLRMWFVAAAPSLELSRERGKPVLQVKVLDKGGTMIRAEHCVYTMSHGWQKCS